MTTTLRTVRYLTMLALSAAPVALLAADLSHPALTGAWSLNHSASDTGGAPQGGGGEGGGRHHGGAPGGGGGHGGYGGHGGGGGGYGHGGGRGGAGGSEGEDADRDQMRDRMERVHALFEPAERLTITEDGDAVTMVDGEGRSEKLVANGKKEQHLVGNTQAELKTTWQDGRLVSDIALGNNMNFKRTIGVETASDGVRRLTIELKAEGGMGGDRPPLKRVYDLTE